MTHNALHYHATVIVTSDTCCIDPTKDTSGQYVKEKLENLEFKKVTKLIVEDDKQNITNLVKSALDDPENVLIITVGGTGLCPRDVTPEATSVLYEKSCTGIVAALHMTSLRYSSHAALSRLTAGIVNKCLIVNFPGSLKACRECFACLEGFLFHALEQVSFNDEAIRATHSKMTRPTAVVKSQKDQDSTFVNVEETNKRMDANHVLDPDIIEQDISDIDQKLKRLLRSNNEPDDNSFSKQNDLPAKVSSSPKNLNCRLNSPYEMIDYESALKIMNSFVRDLSEKNNRTFTLDHKDVTLDLLGNIIANDLQSRVLVPPFAVSTMDGYVINLTPGMRTMLSSIVKPQAHLVEDLEQFELFQKSYSSLHRFVCYQVNTGGRLPERDFAIIPFEKTGHVIYNELENKKVVPIMEIKPDRYIRKAGSDLNHDDFIPAGTKIGPVEVSLIQSMGHKSVQCISKPTIGILSTGDELIESQNFDIKDATKVVDINGPLLTSYFKQRQFQVVATDISKDKPEDIALKVDQNLALCDVLLITGGASMGTKDHVKDVIVNLGGTIHFGRVKIKPGKPAGFSSIDRNGKRKFIFTLPGNPVSAFVTSIVLVSPFLQGVIESHVNKNHVLNLRSVGKFFNIKIEKIIDKDEEHPYVFDGRMEFLRAKLLESAEAKPEAIQPVAVSIKQQSSRMLSFLECDCLIIIDTKLKDTNLEEGSVHKAIHLRF